MKSFNFRLSFLLLFFTMFNFNIQAEDICYSDTDTSGGSGFMPAICLGALDVNCRRITTIDNVSGEDLTEVYIYSDVSNFVSMDKDCGVDNDESQCSKTDGVGIGPIGFFGEAYTYDLDDMTNGDSNSQNIWFDSTAIMNFTNTDNMYTSYIKNGVTYNTKVYACGSTPTFSTLDVSDVNITSDPASTKTMNFIVTVTPQAEVDGYILYHTDDGTAIGGTDYVTVAEHTQVDISNGDETVEIPITINANSSGIFYLILEGAYNAGVNDGNATGTIKSRYVCSKPKDFSLRESFIINGDLVAIGNSSICADIEENSGDGNGICDSNQGQTTLVKNQNNNMIFINATSSSQVATEPSDLNNTTAANLNLPDGAVIEWAGLYWQAQIHNIKTDEGYSQSQAANMIKFKAPSGSYIDLAATADNHRYIFLKNGGRYEEHYQSFVDVTQFMNGSGDYWVANMQATVGQLPVPGVQAAWSLQVVYSYPGASPKSIAINDGYQGLYGNSNLGVNYATEINELNGNSECSEVREDTGSYGKTVDVPVSGFITPKAAGFKNNFTVFMTDPDPSGRGDESFAITKDGASDTIIDENIAGENFTGWFYGIDDINVSSNGTRTVTNNLSRTPNYINPIGMSIKNYEIIDALATEQTSATVKFVTGPDKLFLGVIGFSTELRGIDLCYDYTYGQNNHFITAGNLDNPEIDGTFSEDYPIDVKLYFENRENSDIVISNLKVHIDPIDTDEAIYDRNSTYLTPPGSTKVHVPDDAAGRVVDDDKDNNISVGGLGSLENFYVYYGLSLDADDSNGIALDNTIDNMPINATLEFDLTVLGIPLGTSSLSVQDMDICQNSGAYSPTAGLFNVVHNGEISGNEPGYYFNLPTQVVNRTGNYKVISLKGNDFNVSDTNITTSVMVEMLDVAGFHYATATCNDQDVRVVSTGIIADKVWATFSDPTSSTVDLNKAAMQNAGFFNNAISNAAFRISYPVDENGTVELFENVNGNWYLKNFNSYGGQDCQEGAAKPNVSSACGSNGANGNGNGGQSGLNATEMQECIECIYGQRVKNLCSRDNFAIRPESYKVEINDFDHASGASKIPRINNMSGGTSIDLAAGYDYILDINATDHLNNLSAPLYDTSAVDINLTWTPAVGISTGDCNNEANQTISATFYNGNVDANLSIYEVGDYTLSVTDTQWTKVDHDAQFMTHHTVANNFNPSHTIDCVNSDIVNTSSSYAQNGCIISSSHTNSENSQTYTNLAVEFHPYSFSITPIVKVGLNNLPAGASSFVYMANVSTDENMSVQVLSTISAIGENGTTALSNFTEGCYVKPINITVSKIGAINTALNYSYIFHDYNATGNIITAHNSSGTAAYNASPTISTNDGPPNTYFKKLQAGSIVTTINMNFDRNNTLANPEDINFTTYRVSDSANTFNADLITNKFADGNATINQSVKHYYGRTHASRQRYENNTGTANIYYEAHCFGVTGGNTCDKTLLPQGINSKRTDDIRWYMNTSHTSNEGSAGTVSERAATVHVTVAGTTTGNHPDNSTLMTYDENQGYPYKTTMENNASRWLIYNEDDPTATRNNFSVEFNKASIGWSGEHNTTTTTKKIGNIRTNRRSNW